MKRYKVTVTTAADGTATAYSPRLSGEIHSIQYVKTDFANGVDFTITSEATGEQLWAESDVNASAVRYPRQATHSNAGVASLYAAAGTAVQARDRHRERPREDRARGWAATTKVGTFHILVA
jgi:hypothetical protein